MYIPRNPYYGHGYTDIKHRKTVYSLLWLFIPLNQLHINKVALTTSVRSVLPTGLGMPQEISIPQRWILRHDRIVILYIDSEEAHQIRFSKG